MTKAVDLNKVRKDIDLFSTSAAGKIYGKDAWNKSINNIIKGFVGVADCEAMSPEMRKKYEVNVLWGITSALSKTTADTLKQRTWIEKRMFEGVKDVLTMDRKSIAKKIAKSWEDFDIVSMEEEKRLMKETGVKSIHDWHERFFAMADIMSGKRKDITSQKIMTALGVSKEQIQRGFNLTDYFSKFMRLAPKMTMIKEIRRPTKAITEAEQYGRLYSGIAGDVSIMTLAEAKGDKIQKAMEQIIEYARRPEKQTSDKIESHTESMKKSLEKIEKAFGNTDISSIFQDLMQAFNTFISSFMGFKANPQS